MSHVYYYPVHGELHDGVWVFPQGAAVENISKTKDKAIGLFAAAFNLRARGNHSSYTDYPDVNMMGNKIKEPTNCVKIILHWDSNNGKQVEDVTAVCRLETNLICA